LHGARNIGTVDQRPTFLSRPGQVSQFDPDSRRLAFLARGQIRPLSIQDLFNRIVSDGNVGCDIDVGSVPNERDVENVTATVCLAPKTLLTARVTARLQSRFEPFE
jgi:hypothetical protein